VSGRVRVAGATVVLGKDLAAFERTDTGEGPAITEGDVAILQFLAAAELIESDLCRTR
jgi:hypothetical protein